MKPIFTNVLLGSLLVSAAASTTVRASGLQDSFTLQAEPEISCLDCASGELTSTVALDGVLGQRSLPQTDLRARILESGLFSEGEKAVFPQIGIEDLVRFGKEAWKFIVENRPVVNATSETVSIVPKGVTDWTQLTGWAQPEARTFKVTYKNLLGWEVMNFSYRIVYTPGGKYNDKGSYLTQVTVEPHQISAYWGFSVEAKASVPSIVNLGTVDDPVAGAQILVEWTAKSLTSHFENTRAFFVTGVGQFRALQ